MPRIEKEQFERCLEELERDDRDPRLGLFGPGSAVWKYGRESVVMLGGGRAALMQAAHPQVAWAVTSHSAVMADVAGRFRRTFDNVFAMTFGDRGRALRRARRVRQIHEHVNGVIEEDVGRFRRGDAFDALDREATLWVAATLWDTEVLVNELLVGPIPPREKERFYQESLRFLRLFGIPPEDAPPDWWAFRRWVDDTIASDSIAVGRAAREVHHHIVRAPRTASRPAYAWIRAFTASILPPKLREGYGMGPSRTDELVASISRHAIRRGVALLPSSLRHFPGYLDARRRLSQSEGRDPVGELVERVVLAGLRPSAPG